MTTDYDPIAELYKRAKQQPWRTHVEAYSLMQLVGDVAGISVMDVACGEGFYTRLLRQQGAARVLGVDLSARMIELAREQEKILGQGIEYQVADAKRLVTSESFDLVVAAYLLNYAGNRGELQAICDGLSRSLRPGGRFVTINSNPDMNHPTAAIYRKYGFETRVAGPCTEGTPIHWRFHLEERSFDIENYHLSVETHDSAFRAAGFRQVCWHAPRVSPQGNAAFEPGYWQTLLDSPPVILIECTK